MKVSDLIEFIEKRMKTSHTRLGGGRRGSRPDHQATLQGTRFFGDPHTLY